jgi:serine/threonine-protein kinase
LSHPHILPVHDSGEAAGFLFYVMPFVQGESLRQRLHRDGPLPIEEALRIARETAAALSYAHSQDIVHRDIKPENILLHHGEAMVADFGIARAASAASARLTETGVAVGTPSYMSPEQASGTRAVTGASDLYSLACVLYEMLTGEPPFTGASAQAILARHAIEPAPSVQMLRATVPEDVDAAVRRALAKTPADRFATTGQFVAALEASEPTSTRVSRPKPAGPQRRPWWPHVLAVLALAVMAAVIVVLGIPQKLLAPGAHTGAIRSVAVLPFENLGGGEEHEAFIAGLHHDLLTHLNRIEGLAVRSRTSVLSHVDRGMSLAEIGRALQVDAVMEGGVQWAGGTLRINAQLIDAETDAQIWADQYDHETTTDLLTTQTAIVRKIASELGVRISAAADERVARRPTENDEAYDLYLRAYPLVAEFRDPQGATALLERAVALDPGFALAYALLARATLGNRAGLSYGGAIDSGLILARHAVALDPDVGETQAALGLMFDAKMAFDEAEQHYRRSIELSPGDAFTYLVLGEMMTTLGLLDEAQELIERAQVLDPSLRPVGFRLAEVLFEQRDYAEAIHVATTYRTAYPEFGTDAISELLGWAYVASGRYRDALEIDRESQERVDTIPRNTEDQRAGTCGVVCVMALAGTGDSAAARESLRVLEREQRAGFRGRGARAYVAVGEYDRAFEMLEWWVDGGYWRNLRLLTHPFWDPLRSDPRFDRLLRRTGL